MKTYSKHSSLSCSKCVEGMGFESSKYGQLLKHCHFKYKERKDSEFEENFTDVRKENILLS